MRTRKELPKTALPRIYFIDRQIASGSYPNSRILAEAYETSESTINRDIDFMRSILNAPIIFDHDHNGYYYAEKTWRLTAGYATAEELLALALAKNLLVLCQGTPLYETARQSLEIISIPLAAAKGDTQKSAWYTDRIIVPQVATSPVPPELWQTLVKALADNRVITFDYTGTWDEKPCPRRVRPYQLLFDTGVWFLYGFDEDQAGLRMFSLARTQNARLRDQGFTLPDDYDYRLRVDGSRFGVFAGGERRRFRVVFYGEAVVWAEERQWAADQRVEEFEEEGETCCVVEFTSAQYEKVLEWVLSKGCNARPLEPPELAVDWRYHIAELAKMV